MANRRNYSNIYYNSRVQLYRLRGYDNTQARSMAREDAIRRGQSTNANRAVRDDSNNPRMTRSQRYLAERGNGESRAYSREVALAMYGERGRRLERRGITTNNINPNTPTTQGARYATQGSGGGVRSGSGSGG